MFFFFLGSSFTSLNSLANGTGIQVASSRYTFTVQTQCNQFRWSLFLIMWIDVVAPSSHKFYHYQIMIADYFYLQLSYLFLFPQTKGCWCTNGYHNFPWQIWARVKDCLKVCSCWLPFVTEILCLVHGWFRDIPYFGRYGWNSYHLEVQDYHWFFEKPNNICWWIWSDVWCAWLVL